MPNPDGVKAVARANKDGSDSDIRAVYADKDGSLLLGGVGDDVLRGGNYDDWLVGGRGDDQMYGGGGADQFRFFGNQIGQGTGENAETVDRDRVYDLDFSEGDVLVFGALTGLEDAAGIDAYTGGTAATVSSWEGIANLVEQLGGTATQRGTTDNLLVSYVVGGMTQQIEITGGWTAYSGLIG